MKLIFIHKIFWHFRRKNKKEERKEISLLERKFYLCSFERKNFQENVINNNKNKTRRKYTGKGKFLYYHKYCLIAFSPSHIFDNIFFFQINFYHNNNISATVKTS